MTEQKQRSNGDISEALAAISTAMIRDTLSLPPALVVMLPTVIDCLRELTLWRSGVMKVEARTPKEATDAQV